MYLCGINQQEMIQTIPNCNTQLGQLYNLRNNQLQISDMIKVTYWVTTQNHVFQINI